MVEKNKRVVGDERSKVANDLKKRYNNGASMRELAESTGRSFGWVNKMLRESGAKIRPRGGPNR